MRTIVLLVVGIVTAAVLTAMPMETQKAEAATFDAGHIIDDEVFYDSTTMTESQIRSFINSKVPACTSGYTCLDEYKENTTGRSADSYCKAIAGGKNEDAARIIYKVSRACDINPQVILVTLQKEQGLLTHHWPSEWRYTIAMGFGCPDGADCNSKYFGFQNQLYLGARQFQIYRAWPNSFNYVAGKTNSIKWHPNSSCGTSRVYIENQATAGLYNYTPYRPNQAALNAGYGTGDSCSSYGNRNFFLYFNDWFGSTYAGPSVHPKLQTYYTQNGGASGLLGKPTSEAKSYADGGVGQKFEMYVLYRTPQGQYLRTTGTVGDEHWRLGGGGGMLGYPSGNYTKHANGGRSQAFQNGTLYWHNSYGTYYTTGVVRTKHDRLGGGDGVLGFPSGEYTVVGSGRSQAFVKGGIYWSSRTGAKFILGGMAKEYAAMGGPKGDLGFPTSDYVTHKSGLRSQSFQVGDMYWMANSGGVRYILGGMANTYAATGGPSGELGYPTSDYVKNKDGSRFQSFEVGDMYWAPGRDVRYILGGMANTYAATGGPSGELGYPTSDYVKNKDGSRFQSFDVGDMYWAPGFKVRYILGGMADTYAEAGGPASALGYPTGDYTKHKDGSRSQQFEHGTMTWAPGGDVVVTIA
ncbi:LGFP repeat-containing protein [Paramicrobacterium agarici]|uniref:LGFP repeat-containing protein n=2 Tax=Paramicrobacterium agarici TaxID=630514 RepID=A0A2A9E128_9MICO|nr:LGFP repeat-containing protein [Microbacterium agarici]